MHITEWKCYLPWLKCGWQENSLNYIWVVDRWAFHFGKGIWVQMPASFVSRKDSQLMPFSLTFTQIQMSEIPPPTNMALPFCLKPPSTTFFVEHSTDGKKKKKKEKHQQLAFHNFIPRKCYICKVCWECMATQRFLSVR